MAHKAFLLPFSSVELLSRRRVVAWGVAPTNLRRALYGAAATGTLAMACVYALAVMFGASAVPTLQSFWRMPSVGVAAGVDVLLLTLVVAHVHYVQRPYLMRTACPAVLTARAAAQDRLLASALLLAFFFAWQPLPQTVWSAASSGVTAALWTAWALGWMVLLGSLILLDRPAYLADILPLRTVRFLLRQGPDRAVRCAFNLIRTGVAGGLLLIEWCAPHMSLGHLLFAAVVALYLAGARFLPMPNVK